MREKTVLIIDDEKRMADSLRDLLRNSGYRVQVAYGSLDGMDMLKHSNFHVLVTDLRMPDQDGIEVIRYAHEHCPQTLTIVITGYASAESAIEALHYKVFDYLRKPFDFDLFRMAIEKAFQKIESDQLREDTAAMITHDIKIPLTSIIGFASMLYDREQGKLHPRSREFAEAIQVNGQKILAMIENYLTTCTIEAGTLKIVPVPVDPRQMILDIIESSMVTATRHGRMIEHEIADLPSTIDVDEPLVYRAFSNMIQNAIKYSDEGDAIRVRAGVVDPTLSPLKAPSLCVEVINHGIGIAPEDFENIFQRYKRVKETPGIEGSGLGLYVVYAIAKAHCGDVSAEVLENGLIRFAIYLPLGPLREAKM